MEIWKDVVGYKGLYKISSYGRVEGQKRNILKQSINPGGYSYVNLCDANHKRTNTRVHRLVAEAFLSKVPKKNVVNHKDGNKNNNHLENLEWCTQSHNLQHAFKLGLNKKTNQYMGVQKIDIKTNEVIKEYNSISEVARDMGYEDWKIIKGIVSNISKCAQGKVKTAYKYKWRYI